VADIAIRMMTTGDKPRPLEKREPMPIAQVAGLTEGTVMHSEEPWLDPDEMADPRLRLWRETLRQRYNFNKKRK
jgi:hypothetical protein